MVWSSENMMIAGLSKASKHKRGGFDGIISISDGGRNQVVRFYNEPKPDQIFLVFEDIDTHQDNLRLCQLEDVERSIKFAKIHSRLLIHCKAGIGRSTGIALGVIMSELQAGQEELALQTLYEIAPDAAPSLTVVRAVEDYLGLGDGLEKAIEKAELQNEKARNIRSAKREMWRKIIDGSSPLSYFHAINH